MILTNCESLRNITLTSSHKDLISSCYCSTNLSPIILTSILITIIIHLLIIITISINIIIIC